VYDVLVMVKRKISLKVLRKVVLGFAFAILFFGVGYRFAIWKLTGSGSDQSIVRRFISNPEDGIVEGADFRDFWEVWRRLEKSYVDVDAIDYQKMTYGSIEGLAQSLGDPYTRYFPPEDNKLAEEDLNGSFYGVGIELGYREGILAVISPLANTPAKKAGLKAGDLIMHIKDESKGLDEDTAGMSLIDAVKKIRGEKGVPITFKIAREGEKELLEITVVRDEIVVPSLKLEYIDEGGKKIAHLKLFQFGGRTNKEWLEKIHEIQVNKVDGMILDLRNNPGGYLDGAIFIASEFLSDGVIVSHQGRYRTESYSVNRRGNLLDIPLVVLVNKGSASASEITAGALQAHGRAKIMGEQSFGKGTVQEVQDLNDGSSLHVTVAKWLLPDGKWIGDGGITPDVEVKDNPETEGVDEVVEKAVEELISKK